MTGSPDEFPEAAGPSALRACAFGRLPLAGSHFSHNAPEAHVRGGGVDGLRKARRRTIATTVARRAEVRATFEHLARNPDLRLVRVVALRLDAAARVVGHAAGLLLLVRVARRVPVGRPLPHVADHVVQPVAVGWERAHRRRSLIAVLLQVLPRELALPGVG